MTTYKYFVIFNADCKNKYLLKKFIMRQGFMKKIEKT